MRLLSLGFLCLGFVGCAGSNGGGHVVGNPMIPTSAASQMSTRKFVGCRCDENGNAQDCTDKDKSSGQCTVPCPCKK